MLIRLFTQSILQFPMLIGVKLRICILNHLVTKLSREIVLKGLHIQTLDKTRCLR